MSYRDPGGAFAPPPPPAKKRSPWLFVGVGCGALALVLGVFFALMALTIGKKIQEPLDQAAVLRSMRGIPVFPGAELDEYMTQAQRAAAEMMPVTDAETTHVAAYATPHAPEEVMSWYDITMPGNGFTLLDRPNTGGVRATLYQKGKDAVLLYAQDLRERTGGTTIIIHRYINYRER